MNILEKRPLKALLLVLSVCMAGAGSAQQEKHNLPDSENRTDESWESIAEELLEEGDLKHYEEWWQTLEETKRSPLNLNTVSFDSLNMLGLLTSRQIENILEFRKTRQGFRSIHELLLVKGIGLRQLAALKPLLYIGGQKTGHQKIFASGKADHEILFKMNGKMPQNEGLETDVYPGPPFGTTLKYKGMNNRFKLSLTAENDAGEKFFTQTQKAGFDFISGAFSCQPGKIIPKFIIGDFKIQWGQGLVLWQGFTAGGENSLAGLEKSARGAEHYSSSGENGFFRGAALDMAPSRYLKIGLFCSFRKLDGKTAVTDTVSKEERTVSSLYETGLHRTESERQAKRAVDESAGGISLEFNSRIIRLQAHYLHYNLKPPHRSDSIPYRKYADNGAYRDIAGISWKTAFKQYYLYGEAALDDRKGTAVNIGIRKNFNPLSIGAAYRRYDKRYASIHANASGSYSNSSNEEGVTAALEATPAKGLQIRILGDYYHFFAPRYRALIPDNGAKARLEILYRQKHLQHLLSAVYKYRPEESAKYIPSHRSGTDLKYQLTAAAGRQIELRGRIQAAFSGKDGKHESGVLLSGDLIYTHPTNRFKMQNRIAWFHTDSYYTRIYLYENNVLYGYSTPSFQGAGWRIYTNLTWKQKSRFSYYAKLGLTCKPGCDSWGSGHEKTKGASRADITAQIRYTF